MNAARRDLVHTVARLEARTGESHGISLLSQFPISATPATGTGGAVVEERPSNESALASIPYPVLNPRARRP